MSSGGALRAVVLAAALLGPYQDVYGQSATASQTQTRQSQTSQTQPKPEDFWSQEKMTGDWGRVRSRWEEKGVELNFSLAEFLQGVAEGGIRTGAVGNGKFMTGFKFDFGKLTGCKNWLGEIKTETRYGGPLLLGAGAINPVNTAALIPTTSGTSFTITALNLTKLFPIDMKKGDLIAVSFGRFNLLDLIEENFFAGRGIERFFNLAQIGPLTVVRQVPLVTNMVNFAYIRGGEPVFTFALLDPNDHTLNPGLSDLFADGVTFYPAINFPVTYFGKTARHTIGGAVTTKQYTPFDAIKQIIIPGPPINPVEPQRGSWSVNYTFRQYIVERAKKEGWGFFAQFAAADESTSPITRFLDVGIGGDGLFEARPKDQFGIAYAYTDLSEILKDNLDPLDLRRLRAEHQMEIFYNFHITPWLRLTGDLQILRPARPIATTAVVPGGRLEIIF